MAVPINADAKKKKKAAPTAPEASVVATSTENGEKPGESESESGRTEDSDAALKRLGEKLKNAVASSGFKAGELGLWVGRKGSGGLETWFAQNSDKDLIPASLSKLVTAGAVLSSLPSGFKFKTTLVSDAKVDAGTLKGHLYLKGGGDPSFVSENMWFLVNELTRVGVTAVDGDIVVDDSRFDNVRFGQDRQDERVDRAYDAPVGAMSMNWNSVTVYVRPGDEPGQPAKVYADVMSPYIKVKNLSKTVAAGRGKTIGVERSSEKGHFGDVITVTGSIARDVSEVAFYKSISQPDLWSGHNLVEFLKQRGISVKGAVRTGLSPSGSKVLASADSKPIAQVVGDMSKWSNNYVSEMLVKNLAAEAGEAPATMDAGMKKVRNYLSRLGFKAGEYEFINAAGFTRRNRLSAQQIGQFLESVHTDFTFFPEYLVALPIGGIDGTLKNRMKGSAAERWVRAKTGLLNGVVGLAGFAGRDNGDVATFAFVYNGGGREDRARALFDRMAAIIVEN